MDWRWTAAARSTANRHAPKRHILLACHAHAARAANLPAAEFYQTLLREFLEGSADAGGANWHTVRRLKGGAQPVGGCCTCKCVAFRFSRRHCSWLASLAAAIHAFQLMQFTGQHLRVMPQGPKHRKAVDRRASKGRKLRYHVRLPLALLLKCAPVLPIVRCCCCCCCCCCWLGVPAADGYTDWR